MEKIVVHFQGWNFSEDGEDSSPLPRVEIQTPITTLPVVEEPPSPVITYADKTRDPGQR